MEKIYTIPVNEAFGQTDICPFCLLHRQLEHNELELIMGASMMEPDTRIQTNKLGFCRRHFEKMYGMKNRLGLALMLESHLDSVQKALDPGLTLFSDPLNKSSVKTGDIVDSCYLCDRIERTFDKMMETACLLWNEDPDFRVKFAAQSHFCLEHYSMILSYAATMIDKKSRRDFLKTLNDVEAPYVTRLKENVSFFCKKFDYRYADEPWGDAQDAVEKALYFLGGEDSELK